MCAGNWHCAAAPPARPPTAARNARWALFVVGAITLAAAAQRNYYEVLEVSKDASSADIRKAYRRLALQWHPDKNESPKAALRFREVAEAYEVLGVPERRQQYDLSTGGAEFSFDAFVFQDPESIFKAFFGDDDPFKDFEKVFQDMESAFNRDVEFAFDAGQRAEEEAKAAEQAFGGIGGLFASISSAFSSFTSSFSSASSSTVVSGTGGEDKIQVVTRSMETHVGPDGHTVTKTVERAADGVSVTESVVVEDSRSSTPTSEAIGHGEAADAEDAPPQVDRSSEGAPAAPDAAGEGRADGGNGTAENASDAPAASAAAPPVPDPAAELPASPASPPGGPIGGAAVEDSRAPASASAVPASSPFASRPGAAAGAASWIPGSARIGNAAECSEPAAPAEPGFGSAPPPPAGGAFGQTGGSPGGSWARPTPIGSPFGGSAWMKQPPRATAGRHGAAEGAGGATAGCGAVPTQADVEPVDTAVRHVPGSACCNTAPQPSATNQYGCCQRCLGSPSCEVFVWQPSSGTCWLLQWKGSEHTTMQAPDRVMGGSPRLPGPAAGAGTR